MVGGGPGGGGGGGGGGGEKISENFRKSKKRLSISEKRISGKGT